MKTFSVGTFNVRGLNDQNKRKNLSTDLKNYNFDVICLQETKIKEGCSEDIDGNELICFDKKQEAHGLDFIVSRKCRNSVERQWKVNDRIAVIGIEQLHC